MWDQLRVVYRGANTAVTERGYGKNWVHLNPIGDQQLLMKIVLTDLGLEAYETPIGRNKTEEINTILDLNLEGENGDAADQVDNQ